MLWSTWSQHGLQATLDERRLATMQRALLEKVQQMVDSLPSVETAHPKQASSAADVVSLAESGNVHLLDVAAADVAAADAAQAPGLASMPDSMLVDGIGPERIAWGGLDIVVFVRHDGLLLPAALDGMRVQYPPDRGPWCESGPYSMPGRCLLLL